MRKNLFIVAIAALVVCSCKSSNTVVVPMGDASPTGIKAAVTEGSTCYELQEQKPALRAVGNGINNKEAAAKQAADAAAKAEFATKIAAAMEAGFLEVGVSLDQFASDGETGKSVADQSSQGGNIISMAAKQVVKNTSIIQTERYVRNDRQYLIYVCIEYSGNLSDLFNKAEKELKEKIPAEQRKILEERHEKMEKKFEQMMSSL